MIIHLQVGLKVKSREETGERGNSPPTGGWICVTIHAVMSSQDDGSTVLRIVTRSPAETERLGEQLGTRLRRGDLICLAGDLGSGKTCLTRGLARGWGAVEHPTSPTFTLVNQYHRAGNPAERFYHVDCYRLTTEAEAWTIGLDDLFDGGVVVIEWPERIQGTLPAERLWIQIRDLGGESREFTLRATGERPVALLRALREPEERASD